MRPLKVPTMLLLLGFILFFSQAFAEYYRYTDENGNTRYTDNISAVPENQRPNVDEYQEYQINNTDDTQDDSRKKEMPPSQQDETQKSDQAFTAADDKGAALFQKKQYFDNEHKTLVEEKKALENSYGKIRSEAGLKEYSEKSTKLNIKIMDYEKRRAAFSTQADEYNARLKEKLKQESRK